MKEETYYLERDCPATLIPAGDRVVLEKGSPVSINQALGGSITVTAPNGLFRVEKTDFDALGATVAAELNQVLASSVNEGDLLAQPFSEEQVWHVLKSCFDPEIPVNIVDLGLIYSLEIKPQANGSHQVDAKMTLTAQGCGMGPTIAADAKEKIESLPGVEFANVQIVWEPPWNAKMISEEGKQKLGLK